MTYQNVWWYPNYIEYGSGHNHPKTWNKVMEQYRRPNALYDLRYYDLPTEEYEAKLYYNQPRLGQPKYRATFRDKPHTVASHYPGPDPRGKPIGFHGRVYYEDGPPTFKYEGPKQDKLYWLERPPLVPVFGNNRPSSSTSENTRGLNEGSSDAVRASRDPALRFSQTTTKQNLSPSANCLVQSQRCPVNTSRRMTQDGVGYL